VTKRYRNPWIMLLSRDQLVRWAAKRVADLRLTRFVRRPIARIR